MNRRAMLTSRLLTAAALMLAMRTATLALAVTIGWLGLIGAIDSFVSDQRRNPMLISQSSRFAELQSRIDGQVLTAGDDAWDASRQTFNLTHDQQPAALVRVASAQDVAETVRYAAKHGLRIAPQGTLFV